jgi:phage tail-like protein
MTIPMTNPQRNDPYKIFNFRLSWNGKVVAAANKVSGLPPSPDAPAQPVAAGPPPVRTKYEPITLESGLTHDPTFQNWANKIGDPQNRVSSLGPTNSQDFVLESFNEAGQKLLTWSLQGCWVSEFQSVPELSAGVNAVAIEHLVLQHEGLIIPKTSVPQK